MRSARFGIRYFMLMLACSLACSAARAADVLKQLPEKALAVVAVPSVEGFGKKIDDIAKQLQMPAPSLVDLAEVKLGLAGLIDRDGSAAFVVMPKADGELPGKAILLPTKDYAKLVEQLNPDDAKKKIAKIELNGKESAITKLGDYAAIAPIEDEAILEQLSEGARLGDKIGAMAGWIKQQDAYALATPGGIAMAADKVLAEMDKAKKQFEQQGEGPQAEMVAMAFGMYGEMFKTAKNELTFAAVGFHADAKGLHVTSRELFKAGSSAAKIAAANKPADGGVLAGLPKGKYVLVGGTVLSKEIMLSLFNFSGRMLKVLPNTKEIKNEDIEEMMRLSAESFAGVKSWTFGMLAGSSEGPLYSHAIGVMKVDDSAKFLASYKKTLAAMNVLAEKAESPFIQKNETKSIELDGKDALEVTLKLVLPNQDPISAEVMRRLMGDTEKMKVYIAAADANTVVMGYITPDNVKAALKGGAGGPTGDAELEKTMALLPSGAQTIGFLNLKHVIDMVIANVPGIEGTPVPALVGGFPETPPIGFGAKFSDDGLETDFVVPGETLEAIGATIAKARAASASGLLFGGAVLQDAPVRKAPKAALPRR